jgi:hypothetical protein
VAQKLHLELLSMAVRIRVNLAHGQKLEHPLAPRSIECVDLTISGLQTGRDKWGSVVLTGLGHPSVPHVFQGR